ncbi:hypothetical protein BDF19DRAFT_88755 [Syncephalis fuscata]|nr:hypothetical protein BDF19DRAFT_88755 [Syncephalis fuscata]
MDDLQANSFLSETWRESAVKLFNIPLHPSGEMSPYTAIIQNTDNQTLTMEATRVRLAGLQVQIVVNIVLSMIFILNLNVSIQTAKSRLKNIGVWCCIISSVLGASIGLASTLVVLDYANCRQFVWYNLCAGTVAICCNSTTVLQQAHLALQRKRRTAIAGILCILLELSIGPLAIAFSYVTVEDHGGCVAHYPRFVAWLWFLAIMPINAFFSAIFSYIVYKQYRKFGSDAWRRLARHGIQTMCLVVLCNIICGACLILKAAGDISPAFFNFDWVITTTILAHHCVNMYTSSGSLTASEALMNVTIKNPTSTKR